MGSQPGVVYYLHVLHPGRQAGSPCTGNEMAHQPGPGSPDRAQAPLEGGTGRTGDDAGPHSSTKIPKELDNPPGVGYTAPRRATAGWLNECPDYEGIETLQTCHLARAPKGAFLLVGENLLARLGSAVQLVDYPCPEAQNPRAGPMIGPIMCQDDPGGL